MSVPMCALEELMAPRRGSVDPSKHPDEIFDLYSIPAFDSGNPEVIAGNRIGSAKQIVEPGDLLLSRIVPHIRRSWVVGPSSGRRIIASGEWIVFRSHRVHPEYLRHVLVGDSFHASFMQTVSGVGGSLLRARPAYVAKISVPLPDIDEQRRVADLLDRAEDLREKRGQCIERLDTLAQALFYERFGDPLQNIRGLPVRPMIDLVDPNRPISYGILMPGAHQQDGVSYVRVVDMKDGGIDVTSVRRTTPAISAAFRPSLLKSGDLLMSIRGHVGRLAIVPPELSEANITQDTARLAVHGASPIYVRECLRTESLQQWMARHTKGVAVRGINLADVKLMPIPLPPASEQEEFACAVAAIDRLRAAQRASVIQLDALFASLQHRAFSVEL